MYLIWYNGSDKIETSLIKMHISNMTELTAVAVIIIKMKLENEKLSVFEAIE